MESTLCFPPPMSRPNQLSTLSRRPPPHGRWAAALIALGLALLPWPGRATTVVPPSFDSLVAQADYVVHAVVKSVSSQLQVVQGHKRIVSYVALDVREVITGNPPAQLVLQMLGGTVGNETMFVEGAPQFQVGDEDILFVHGNGTQLSPLVAIMHGRYPVVHDAMTKADYVARNNGKALYSEQEVALSMEQAPTPLPGAVPLTKAEFIARIRQSRQNAGSRNVPHLQN